MMYQKKPAKYQTSFDLKAQEIPREQETHPVFSAGTEIEPVQQSRSVEKDILLEERTKELEETKQKLKDLMRI